MTHFTLVLCPAQHFVMPQACAHSNAEEAFLVDPHLPTVEAPAGDGGAYGVPAAPRPRTPRPDAAAQEAGIKGEELISWPRKIQEGHWGTRR